MPFESEAQRRYLWMKHPEVAKEFAAATPKGKQLPMHKALSNASKKRKKK
jgi:hypothetical protein